MPETVDIGTLITKNPQVKGGKPCIAGTGTTVLAIVERYESGLSPQDIKDQLPELDLDGIFAALAYAHANRAEIDEWLRLDREAHGSLFGPAA